MKWFSGRRLAGIVAVLLLVPIGASLFLGGKGYVDAVRDAPDLAERADRLIAAGRGGSDLGEGRLDILLRVEDPGFARHSGFDIRSPGAGLTTLTQSLAKRVGFDHFRPGIGKIRQTGYAVGLESRLSKPQIVALFLDTVEMGRGPRGWMTGFFNASDQIFAQAPSGLSDRQFATLVAVIVAPGRFRLDRPDGALDDRVERIERLVAGQCRPTGERDIWYAACASAEEIS